MGQAVAVTNRWADPEHAAGYLARADRMPHRAEGEAVLVGDLAPAMPGRVLDLGCGDGRLAALVLDAYPGSTAVGVDMSETMLAAAARRFGGPAGGPVELVELRMEDPLPTAHPFDEPFDAIVSSFAIHHLPDDRKRSLYAEAAARLAPGGVLANLDVVASPTRALHELWRWEMGVDDDPSDRLCDVESQLGWLRGAGLDDVDCIWKWRGLALLRGRRNPTGRP
jgi:SAM-dependent methyltransferase